MFPTTIWASSINAGFRRRGSPSNIVLAACVKLGQNNPTFLSHLAFLWGGSRRSGWFFGRRLTGHRDCEREASRLTLSTSKCARKTAYGWAAGRLVTRRLKNCRACVFGGGHHGLDSVSQVSAGCCASHSALQTEYSGRQQADPSPHCKVIWNDEAPHETARVLSAIMPLQASIYSPSTQRTLSSAQSRRMSCK